MIFELVQDFHDAVTAMSKKHPKHHILELFEEAIRRDVHFVGRHPTTLFQCMWNTCWWYDCPEAVKHYEEPEEDRQTTGDALRRGERGELSRLLEAWRACKEGAMLCLPWVRCIRPLPLRLGSGDVLVLRGHGGSVNAVVYSPDGTRLASGSSDKTIRTWSAQSGRELGRFVGHEDAVQTVAFSPDGRRIASGSKDTTVCIWDAQTGARLGCFRGHEKTVNAIAWSPDGIDIVSGGDDKSVRVWPSCGCGPPRFVRKTDDRVTGLACNPDPRRILATGGGAWYEAVWVWDAQTGDRLRGLASGEHWGLAISCRSDGKHAATGGMDGTVRVWDLCTGTEVLCLRGHKEKVSSVAYSRDGKRLASGSKDGTMRVWDAQSGEELLRFSPLGGDLESVAFGPLGQQIAGASSDGTIWVWKCIGVGEPWRLRGHRSPIQCIACSPDGCRVASGSGVLSWFSLQPIAARDNTIRLWHAATGEEMLSLEGHEKRVCAIAFSRDGRMIVTGSEDKTVRVWDSQTGAALHCLRGHGRCVGHVAFSPDGRYIASGCRNGRVRLWEAQTGREATCLRYGTTIVSSVSFSPDSRCLAVEDSSGNLHLWDALAGKSMGRIPLGNRDITGKVHILDAQRLSVLSPGGGVLTYDLEEKKWVEANSNNEAAVADDGQPVVNPAKTVVRGQETVLTDRVSGTSLGWFSVVLNTITAIPATWAWAASVGENLYLIALETGEGAIPHPAELPIEKGA